MQGASPKARSEEEASLRLVPLHLERAFINGDPPDCVAPRRAALQLQAEEHSDGPRKPRKPYSPSELPNGRHLKGVRFLFKMALGVPSRRRFPPLPSAGPFAACAAPVTGVSTGHQ